MDRAADAHQCERWLSKTEMAEHLGCTTRSIDLLCQQGLPYAILIGRRKFQISPVIAWLEATGNLRRHGTLAAPDARSGVVLD
jgi:hypothetical protein